MYPSEKRNKRSGGESIHAVASTSAMVSEIGLPEKDASVGQGTSSGRVDAPTLCEATLVFELPSREELVSGAKFSKRSKYYPRQSAKTSMKDFFELKPPAVLDARHTTTNLRDN